jgi:hypothetical protein
MQQLRRNYAAIAQQLRSNYAAITLQLRSHRKAIANHKSESERKTFTLKKKETRKQTGEYHKSDANLVNVVERCARDRQGDEENGDKPAYAEAQRDAAGVLAAVCRKVGRCGEILKGGEKWEDVRRYGEV